MIIYDPKIAILLIAFNRSNIKQVFAGSKYTKLISTAATTTTGTITRKTSARSVSYTHLDVYKRQIRNRLLSCRRNLFPDLPLPFLFLRGKYWIHNRSCQMCIRDRWKSMQKWLQWMICISEPATMCLKAYLSMPKYITCLLYTSRCV